MRTNLEILLSEWGHWQLGGNRSCLGLPARAAFTSMRVDNDTRRSDPNAFMVDDDLRQVDQAINNLHPDMRVIITAHYMWPGPVKVKSDRLSVTRTAYYESLDYAHKQLSHSMGGIYVAGFQSILSGHLAELSG